MGTFLPFRINLMKYVKLNKIIFVTPNSKHKNNVFGKMLLKKLIDLVGKN